MMSERSGASTLAAMTLEEPGAEQASPRAPGPLRCGPCAVWPRQQTWLCAVPLVMGFVGLGLSLMLLKWIVVGSVQDYVPTDLVDPKGSIGQDPIFLSKPSAMPKGPDISTATTTSAASTTAMVSTTTPLAADGTAPVPKTRSGPPANHSANGSTANGDGNRAPHLHNRVNTRISGTAVTTSTTRATRLTPPPSGKEVTPRSTVRKGSSSNGRNGAAANSKPGQTSATITTTASTTTTATVKTTTKVQPTTSQPAAPVKPTSRWNHGRPGKGPTTRPHHRFRTLEPASTKENNCLNAAKACNLNDTCKKYRSAYINPCTSRVSASEVCNKRKCHKALRQFFDKVPTKYSYGMLFCSCPAGDQTACAERRRQTIVPVCSYEDKDTPNCLSLQNTCKTNYICRSRLADFISNCQPEARSISGCLRENYADCLLSYSGLIGTVMTPNYVRSLGISLSPWCDCSSSGNSKPDCDRFAEFFTNNRCLRNAIQAFGNGTDVGVWQPQPPIQPTILEPSITRRGKDRTNNALDALTDMTKLDLDGDSVYQICGTLQAQKLVSNQTVDTALCVNQQLDESSGSNAIARSSAAEPACLHPCSMLLVLAFALTPVVSPPEDFQFL